MVNWAFPVFCGSQSRLPSRGPTWCWMGKAPPRWSLLPRRLPTHIHTHPSGRSFPPSHRRDARPTLLLFELVEMLSPTQKAAPRRRGSGQTVDVVTRQGRLFDSRCCRHSRFPIRFPSSSRFRISQHVRQRCRSHQPAEVGLNSFDFLTLLMFFFFAVLGVVVVVVLLSMGCWSGVVVLCPLTMATRRPGLLTPHTHKRSRAETHTGKDMYWKPLYMRLSPVKYSEGECYFIEVCEAFAQK